MVDQPFTASGSATLTPALVVADSADLQTNPTTLATWPTIPKASLVQGYRIALAVPRNPAFARGQRYLGLTYTVASGPFTAGKISAALTDKAQSDAAVLYPRAAFPQA